MHLMLINTHDKTLTFSQSSWHIEETKTVEPRIAFATTCASEAFNHKFYPTGAVTDTFFENEHLGEHFGTKPI